MKNYYFLFNRVSFCLLFIIYSTTQAQTTSEQKIINSLRKVAKDPKNLKNECYKLLNSNSLISLYEAHFGLGYAHLVTNQLDSANYYYKKANQFANEINDENKVGSTLKKLQTVNASLGNQSELLKYIQKSKKFAHENNNKHLLAETYKYEGIYFKNLKKFQKSINSSIKAAEINKEINSHMLINNYGNIAIVYKRMQQDQLALEWFRKAYNESEKFDYFPAKVVATNNLANFYSDLNLNDSAKYYFRKLQKDSLKLTPEQKTILATNLIDIYINEDSLVLAKTLLEHNKYYWLGKPITRQKAEFFDEASQYYLKSGDYNRALMYNDSALGFVKDKSIYDRTLNLMLYKSEIHQKMNQHQEAVKIYKEYINLKDSIFLALNTKAIQNSINKFKLSERETELEEAMESRSSLNYYIYLTIALILSAYLYFKLKKQKVNNTQNPHNEKFITLSSKEKILSEEILFIKVTGHYLEYFLRGNLKSVLERNSLKSAIERLNSSEFIQVHRSYLVNTERISKIKNKSIILESGNEIPLSRKFKENFKKNNHPLFST